MSSRQGEPHACARVAYMHHTVWITCTLYIYSCVVNFLPRILDILRVKRHTGGVGFRSFQEIKKKEKKWKAACVGKRLNNFYITYLFIEKKDNIFFRQSNNYFFYKKLMASSAKAWIPVNII